MKSLEERKAARKAAREEERRELESPVAPDYRRMKKGELQKLLRDRNFDVDEKDTVADLIAALEEDDAEKAKE